MRTEKDLQAYFMQQCKKRGFVAVKLTAVGYQGWPDVGVVLRGGDIELVEFKHPNGKGRLRPHQQRMIDRLAELGRHVHVIGSLEGAQQLIRQWDEPMVALQLTDYKSYD